MSLYKRWAKLAGKRPRKRKLTGLYICNSRIASSDVWLSPIGDDHYRVRGEAVWGKERQVGPNMGSLDFTARLNNGSIVHSKIFGDLSYGIALRFDRGLLKIVERNSSAMHGMNVTFAGTYRRASAARTTLWRFARRGLGNFKNSEENFGASADVYVERGLLTEIETSDQNSILSNPTAALQHVQSVPQSSQPFKIGVGEIIAALSIIYVCSIAAFNAGYFSRMNGGFVNLFSFADLLGTNISIVQYFFGILIAYGFLSVIMSFLVSFGPESVPLMRRKAKNWSETLAVKSHRDISIFWLIYLVLIVFVVLTQAFINALEISSFSLLMMPEFLFQSAILYFFWVGYKHEMVELKTLAVATSISLFIFSYDSGIAWYNSDTRSSAGVQAFFAQDGTCLERKIIRSSGSGLLLFNPWIRTFEFRNRDSIKTIFEGKGCP